MRSSEIYRRDSSESTSKNNRTFYFLGLIEFIFISTCLLFLLVNQNLNDVDDNYSRAYSEPDNDDRDSPPVLSTKIQSMTQDMPNQSVTPVQLSQATQTTESAKGNPKTPANLIPEQKEEWGEIFARDLVPGSDLFRLKRGEADSEGKHKGRTETKLTNLLIMYPCCVSAMTLLSMQLMSRIMNDNMHKITIIGLVSICIALGTVVFSYSVIEAASHKNSIAILIASCSAIFIIIEIIEFILLLVGI